VCERPQYQTPICSEVQRCHLVTAQGSADTSSSRSVPFYTQNVELANFCRGMSAIYFAWQLKWRHEPHCH
jgi:hypothetical protein